MKRLCQTLLLAILASLSSPCFSEAPTLTPQELKQFGMETDKPHPKYLLLDFYSATCGVCQHTEPYLREMQKRLKSSIRFSRIDADKHPRQMARFDIEGTPGYFLFDEAGKPVYKMQRFISMEILFTNLQRYSGQLAALPIPKPLLNNDTSVLTPDERKASHYTLIAVHPDGCAPCKTQTPFLNGMALAKGNAPRLNVVTWNPASPEVATLLKQFRWSEKQSYVFLDPENHELVTIDGNPEPKTLWQTLSMLMDNGLGEGQ